METKQGCVELTLVDPIEDSAEITVTTMISEKSLERNADTSVDTESPHTANAYPPGSGTEELEGDKNRSEDYEINIDSEDEDLAVDEPDDCCSRGVRRIKSSINRFTNKHKKRMKTGLYAFLLFLYIVYFSYALYYSFEGAIALFSITVFVVLCVVYMLVRDNFGDKIDDVICRPITDICERHWNIIKWVSAIVTLGLIVVWLVLDTSKNPSNMMSFVGFVVILVFCFVFSKHPDKVRWRPVIWGLLLQIILALVILRTRWGFVAFQFLGEQIAIFIDYVEAGSEFVFGELWRNHHFAFKVLPIILFVGSVIGVLYHVGLVQLVIGKLAWILQFTMQTSAIESLAAAGSIFLSMTEAPLLVGPYVPVMSVSELHAVATSGYATVAGRTLGAGIAIGINPSHVITASVMSAPAALAVSKLFYSETEKSSCSAGGQSEKVQLPKYQNVIDAIARGAMAAVPVVVNVGVNFLVFLAFLEFLNAFLTWAGGMVGYPELSFELICSWVFMPIAYLMGVEWNDCFIVAELIGIKIATSVLVSFDKLAVILENRQLGLEPSISPRSELIATYALCGFSHVAGIGMTMGLMVGLAPRRTKDINAVAVRAMIAGNAANFLTAAIAGILYEGDDFSGIGNSTTVNITGSW